MHGSATSGLRNWSSQRTEKEFGSWFISVELAIFIVKPPIFTELVEGQKRSLYHMFWYKQCGC